AWPQVAKAVVAAGIRGGGRVHGAVAAAVELDDPPAQRRFAVVQDAIAVAVVERLAADGNEPEVAEVCPGGVDAAARGEVGGIEARLRPARLGLCANAIGAC